MTPQQDRSLSRSRSLMRLRGLIRKEFLQIIRDPSSIAIALLLPVVLLIVFGYGVSLDVRHVPIALVLEDTSAEAKDFAGRLAGSPYFEAETVRDMAAASERMTDRRVKGIVRIRDDFSERVKTGSSAGIQVIVDGVDANYGRLLIGYLEGAWETWLQQTAQASGQSLHAAVKVDHRIWFNSAVQSRNFLVPGLIAVIMTLTGALLTAMVMAREWERGTMEALLVTPVRMREVLFSKLSAYFILGIGGMFLSVGMALFVFGIPLRGSFMVLLVTSVLFLLVALGMGLLISTVTKNQFVAGQTAIIVTYLPAFLLSGLIFDITSMPWIVKGITHVIAARYFVSILQTVFLAGNVWAVILPNTAALLFMALFFLGMVRRKSRKRLE